LKPGELRKVEDLVLLAQNADDLIQAPQVRLAVWHGEKMGHHQYAHSVESGGEGVSPPAIRGRSMGAASGYFHG
jgi:hypothetical protein